MKNLLPIFALLIPAAFLSGCKEQGAYAERVTVANPGDEYGVRKLFTVDGCTVYRFTDDRTVYFTNCEGGATWRERQGKTHKDHFVETSVK